MDKIVMKKEDLEMDLTTLNSAIELMEKKLALLKKNAKHMQGWIEEWRENRSGFGDTKSSQFRELLGESFVRSRELCRALEERDKVCKIDKFLPELQILLGNMHGGYSFENDRKNLIHILRNMLLAPVPEAGPRQERKLSLQGWEIESAKAEAGSVFADMERVRRPVLLNRILTERVLLELTSEELCEQSLIDTLRKCGIVTKYYEEVPERQERYFVTRERGASYPAFFVKEPGSKGLICENKGCYVPLRGAQEG